MIAFVQPFGMNSPGGGPRIVRSLLENAPEPFISIATSLEAPPPAKLGEEVHLPPRPWFGRIERTRFKKLLDPVERLMTSGVQRKMEALFKEKKVTAVHAIAHDFSFWPAYQAAKKLKLPFILTVHDDPRYIRRDSPLADELDKKVGVAWRDAARIFVISEQLGREFCSRYGDAKFEIATDGLENVPAAPRPERPKSLKVYFMGLFHLGYSDNWRALSRGLKLFQDKHPDWTVTLTARCGAINLDIPDGLPFKVIDFGSEADVQKDMEDVDLVFMPLHFSKEAELFVRYSLSTKMVTYLGSGLPILFSGPPYAAASELLTSKNAAICVTSLEAQDVLAQLENLAQNRDTVVNNALALARGDFNLEAIRKRFWSAVAAAQA